jgi:hypothetical protein
LGAAVRNVRRAVRFRRGISGVRLRVGESRQPFPPPDFPSFDL